jgi:Flp pilus assembly pilin Flp
MYIRENSVTARLLRLLFDRDGQDLIEYALLAAAVAVAAGAVMPPVTSQISSIFSKIISLATVTPNP